ncbi:Nucleotidyl transferase [Oribacterium sp. KHPX15]|uniref:nucleotidyltransferase family protein n=1 Tax=Oribacterium sp. KHPX15 TaxID=1855342 RepID=UPI00089878E6|nr:sugar phosphate nucleotidyltransferase [Oribacterium sp. KHPX15]SEA36608.1 Nucleotidyl transferase [Oribacterium sp. KHPX15]
MKKTALVIMAAGLGSRFGGGIKQLAKLGPSGEIIMDYSIHDAIEAGFDKIVFIIRKDIEKDFREIIGNRIEKVAKCEYAFQEIDKLPEGYSVPEGRTKPWGTAHALIQVRDLIDCPFAVINADDFYGKEGFKLIHDYLVNQMDDNASAFDICMAGYIVGNTLSDNGTVNRGVCRMGENDYLKEINETYDIEKRADGSLVGSDANGNEVRVDGDAIVSMNMFGLPEKFLDTLIENFPAWLDKNGKEMKSEYLLPQEISGLMQEGKATVRVLKDRDKWFGVTYAEDKEAVQKSLKDLVDKGVYPSSLF